MNGFDVCVRGRGPVGQALALALARLGLRVALSGVAAAPAGPDVRTYALNPRSVALLDSLKVWEALRAQSGAATRLLDMRVQGDHGGALGFSAWQQQVTELGWIVDTAALERELEAALRFSPHVSVVDGDAPSAALTALCEGRDGAERAARGIGLERHDYGQRAIAARLTCDRPHEGRAWQWFRTPDVLALLPFDGVAGGGGYGLVWSLPEARAEALLALDDRAFEAALNEATGGAPGTLALAGPRAAWPLRLARATRWHGPGWVLLGDAAHVVHPLAGQGLNLGLADVETLARVLADARRREPWRTLGDERVLARYARERAAPTWAMGRITDGLLQLFSHPARPVQALRNRGLTLVDHLPPLKRWLTDRALHG